MKLKFPLCLLIFGLLILEPSCRKNINTPEEETPDKPLPPNGSFKNAQVILPTGSNYDLTGHELVTAGSIIPVEKDGKTKVADIKGKTTIAYLFDKDDNPIMAGFVTDSTAIISAETTAKVLLYFAIGVPFQMDTATHIYVNRIGQVPGITDWVNSFTDAWKSDPKTFIKGTYTSALRTWLQSKTVEVTSAGRASSVKVNSDDVRSGLRLHPEGLGLSITNSYRRRATAFAYKMKHKLEGKDHYTPVLNSIGKDTDHDFAISVAPVAGVVSVVGEIWKQVRGTGLQSFAATSGPLNFTLNDNETEAIFKVRVIGPGMGDVNEFTNKELPEYYALFGVTLAVDFVGPVIGTVLGGLFSYDPDLLTTIIVSDIPKIVPGFMESWLSGDIETIFFNLLDGLVSEHGYDIYVKYLETLMKAAKMPKPDNFEDLTKKGARLLMGLDAAMLLGDFIRISHNVLNSKAVEEWELTVRASKVSLLPAESVTSIFSPNNKQEIAATIQNLTDAEKQKSVSYEWSTRGKFGSIADSKGNTGNSFKSSESKVTFTSKNATELTDGDNWEYVYVTAYNDNNVIGRDTARINVKKTRYEMLPEGVTLSGKEGQTNKVNLRLEPINKGVEIGPNADTDFKIVWETAGTYGALNWGSSNGARNITSYNRNTMQYECTDDKTKTATESVTARVFAKKKGAPDLEYQLFDIIKGTVKISNDEKKKVFHVPLSCQHGDTLYGVNSITCMITSFAEFKEDKDAKSYHVRFYNVNNPAGYSWNAGATPPGRVSSYVYKVGPGNFAIAYGSSWGVGATTNVKHHTCAQASSGGMAEVTITMK